MKPAGAQDVTCTACGAPAIVIDEHSMFGSGPEGDIEVVLQKRQCLTVTHHIYTTEVAEFPAPWRVQEIEQEEKAARAARHAEYEVVDPAFEPFEWEVTLYEEDPDA